MRGLTMNDSPQSLEPFLEMVRADQAAGLQDAPWPPVYPKMAGEPSRVAPSRAKKPKTERERQHDDRATRSPTTGSSAPRSTTRSPCCGSHT